ncbi:ABC-F family ATP-binding cassette domain-containing protein [Tepidamorphus sp. 3E244]|uniref:ABC-F family ATP-binding cassette domain-containing protein n=1 Tax=Tepidamorphus sp. 3E244 TaxID=3385498 RepID=UPI0038FCA5D3
MLHINDLTYRIGARVLLDKATIALPDGSRAGLVGRNGAGKSTLLAILLGHLPPESGGVMLPRGARIGTVAQEAPDGPQALIDFVLDADTERRDLMEEAETATDPMRIAEVQTRLADIDAHAAPARAARILSGLGFDEAAQQRPLESFSGGWRMRVALAAILFAEPDVLLLDEPTNYLDLEGTLWLQTYLAKYPHTILIVSHDRDLLNTSVDTIVHLERGKLTAYRGGYDQFERQRAEAQALQMKLKKKQDDQRRHMEAFVERFRAKATKARQAQSRLKALSKLQPIAAIVDEAVSPIVLTGPEKPLAAPIVALEKVAVGYDEKPVLRGLDLRIDPDDRIGLLGSNGNGKSTLAKLVSGRLDVMDGRMKRSDKLTFGYFAQHQLDEIDPAKNAYQLLRDRMPGQTEAKVRARAGALGFPGQKAETPARDLSGGEKARLLLGLVTQDKPHLLILDEPTNHLDVDAREALVRAVNEYSGAVILISHDKHLLETCVDRLWLVANGGVAAFDGDMDDYRKLVLESAGMSRRGGKGQAKNDNDPKADKRRDLADRRMALQPLRDRLKAKDARMAQLRTGIEKLDKALASPGLFERNPKRGAELAKLRTEAERSLVKTEEEWLELSTELEEAQQTESA